MEMQRMKKIFGTFLWIAMLAALSACGNDSKVIEGTSVSESQTEIIGGADGTTEILLTDDSSTGWSFQVGNVTGYGYDTYCRAAG